MDMVWAMAMVLVWDTMAMVWATMARGLLMPSLWPRLMLIPTTMVDTTDMVSAMAMVVWDTTAMAMDMVSAMAMVTVWDTMAMDMDMVSMDMVMDMAMATTDKPSQKYLLHTKHHQGNLDIQDLSVNHQLLCQQKMD